MDTKVKITIQTTKILESKQVLVLSQTRASGEKSQCEDLLCKHYDVFSKYKTDLGRANHSEHKIELKVDDPIYVKQFPMPEVHRYLLKGQIKDGLNMGLVQKSRSRYNSLLFMMLKKDGNLRISGN
jgi:hypothetical protein